VARVWIVTRQAYAPRRWSMLPVSITGAFATSLLTDFGFIGNAVIAVVWGFLPAHLYWRWWLRKHPVLPIEELAARIAPWN